MALALILMMVTARAQQYVSPTQPTVTGKSPGVKAKLLSEHGVSKTYVLVFSRGDEVKSGLTEFAQKNAIQSAHFSGIGDASEGRVGWYDDRRKMFKVIPVNGSSEITALVGNVTMYQGKPAVHAHVNLATEDGIVHGGHLLDLIVGPNLEIFLTTTPTPLNKQLDSVSGAAIIHFDDEK